MVADLKLPLGSRCIKYLMFTFNLIFVITGIILLSIGTTIYAVYNDYPHFLDDKFFSVPSLLIAVGSIIFCIAFFGCCGAVRENFCMIRTFTFLMVVVFILELAAGISGYVLRNDAADAMKSKMQHTMKDYNKSLEITTVWDHLQEDFECCGTVNASDWKEFARIDGLPVSCCSRVIGAINSTTCTMESTHRYRPGCLSTFGHFIRAHAVQLGGAGLGIAFIQAIGIWFSLYLARTIKTSYETV